MNTTGAQDVEMQEKALVFRRRFSAPRDLVFAMFSTDHIAKWWAPEPWRVVDSTLDFRTGGEWRYAMEGPNGERDMGGVVTTYREIVVPERIVMEDHFVDADGTPVSLDYSSVKSIEFVDLGGSTEIILRSEYASAESLQAVLKLGMIEGTNLALDQLATLLVEA